MIGKNTESPIHFNSNSIDKIKSYTNPKTHDTLRSGEWEGVNWKAHETGIF